MKQTAGYISLDENVPVSCFSWIFFFFSGETASTLLYAHNRSSAKSFLLSWSLGNSKWK